MKEARAKILSNEEITAGRFRMRLEAPSICKTAKAGQFVMVKCSEGLEPFLRRPLSLHRIRQRYFELLYEAVGKGTKILSSRKKGERVDVIGPLGNGFDILFPIPYPPFSILVGGGIGVAPLLELAAQLKKHGLLFKVLLGARTKGHILCENEFKALGAKVKIATDDGSKGHKGFVTELLRGELRTTNGGRERSLPEGRAKPPRRGRTTIYACGPKEMLKTAAFIAKKKGASLQFSLEERMACGTGACLGCAVKTVTGYKMVCKDGPVFGGGEIVWEN